MTGRGARSKPEAGANYDRLSRWYDLIAEASEGKLREAGLRKLDAREGERVLEIGPGTGHGVVSLARSVGPSGRVSAVDISAGMLDVTRRRVEAAGLSARVDLRQGDAANLPFEDGSFDAVFLSFTLELFATTEIRVVLSECCRVLRHGGRIGVVALADEGGFAPVRSLYTWAHRLFPRLVDCRPIPVRSALEEAGFRVVDVTLASTWGLSVEIVLARK